ncbi:RNase A-like domain-containing protein [Mycolicibacterium vaccae]|uniref:RNase A-like domain-containing protein n=1 Tax=Mycolicibacterium vaccae TaxID=1810 RepID=UPI003CF3ED35
MAGSLESAIEQHRQNILTPGGTTWEGDAKDAALDRVTADTSVVRRQGDVHRAAAIIAMRGSEDIHAARGRVLEAIAEAEQDDFTVGEDLSVTDNRAYDVKTAAARMTAATEHAEFIRWRAEQLVATDALIGQRLHANAAELEEIRFEGDRDGDQTDPTIRLVDNKTEDKGSQALPEKAADEARADAAESPVEALFGEGSAAEGQQPSSLDEALTEVAGKPAEAPPTAVERILNQHAGTGRGEDRRYTRHPLEAPIVGADPSAIGDQQARVDAAHESVASAQGALDDALTQSTVAGAGAGTSRDQLDALGQALFDARGELTSQTEVLENLNAAAGEVGQGRVPIPELPENAYVQAFPPEPSAFAEGSRALSEGSFGLIPDVAHDIDVFRNWRDASVEDRAGAVLDVAGAAPIPGGKFVTEGLEHAADAFNAGRHVDDALDAGSAGAHQVPDAPSAPHIDQAPDVGGPHGVDAGSAGFFGFEDAGALLQSSEANGGHLIERHVGMTADDLAARIDSTGLEVVSSFATPDEAAAAVSAAFRENQEAIRSWIAEGAELKLELDAPFVGGAILEKGANETVAGSTVRVVLRGDGNGGWYVLTGFPQP